MTACVNEKQSRARGGVFSGKVLRGAMAAVLAIGLCPAVALADDGISTMATDAEAWKANTIDYTVDKDAAGKYVTEVDDIMAVESVTDVYGNAVDDYSVVYFTDNADEGTFDGSDTIVATGIDGEKGGAPNTVGHYIIAVVEGANVDLTSVDDYGDLTGNFTAVGFEIVQKTTALEGAVAYEGTTASENKADTSFAYSGGNISVAFKSGSTALIDGTDYTVVWTTLPEGAADPKWSTDHYTVSDAGTYTAKLTAKDGGKYTGTAEVTFEVANIDLATAEISIAPVAKSPGFTLTSGKLDKEKIVVNGVKLASGAELEATLVAINDETKDFSSYGQLQYVGKYTFRVTDTNTDSENVTGSAVLVDAYVVDSVVSYSYLTTPIAADGSTVITPDFDANKGTVFTPNAISAAKIGSVTPAFTCVVTKDGVEVTSYDEPGEYVVTLDTPVTTTAAGTYAGHATFKFNVAGKTYSDVKVFMSIDGKNVNDNDTPVDYTGKAYEPVVVVKAGTKTLVEGEDYTLAFTDAQGNAVESISAVGDYKAVVTLADVAETEHVINFSIGKAEINAAKATAEFFALPADGSAATPTFVGNTQADFKGVTFDLEADQISVKYYVAEYDDGVDGKVGTADDGGWIKSTTDTDAIDPDELTEEGNYWADINILTTSKTLESGASLKGAHFVLAERVAFSDVDANAWYAEVVYQAAGNGYMNGIGGTDLFMPEADITRSELAGVMFNMAGGQGDAVFTPYPSRFSDVDSYGWYAKAVAWASGSGVMNGYEGTDLFGTYDKATREQVACILYNYAKATGADVSVEDADAALAGFADASEVSGWAKTAVAWAVENGVMGNGGEINAQDTITRAEVAAMAVNFQPEELKVPIA